MKIYTKTGDDGTTMLFGGGRVPKHHARIEAYGTVDELNSYLGLVADLSSDEEVRLDLQSIQSTLFELGAILATNPEKIDKVSTPKLKISRIHFLEEKIDQMELKLTPLKNFILPGGHQTVSTCHVARCVCRRAERQVSYLNEINKIPELLIQYLNRLSDYLFVLARHLGRLLQSKELAWIPNK